MISVLRRVTSVPWPNELIIPRLARPAICWRYWRLRVASASTNLREGRAEDLHNLRPATQVRADATPVADDVLPPAMHH